MKIWRKMMTHLINQWRNDQAVYRTAPATPGLLIITTMIWLSPRSHWVLGVNLVHSQLNYPPDPSVSSGHLKMCHKLYTYRILRVFSSSFSFKFGFWGILGPPSCDIGATIRIGREMLCLPYAGFFTVDSLPASLDTCKNNPFSAQNLVV